MKAKLIKKDSLYELYKVQLDKNVLIGSSDYDAKIMAYGKDIHYKLSIQNCDSLFGVVDVEKLAKEKYPNVDNEDYEYDSEWQMLADEYKQKGFIQGAKEILELNKDKVFTLEDMKKAYLGSTKYEWFGDLIKSLQQPTEIEVMIVMYDFELPGKPIGRRVIKPKLDSSENLILKKI